MSKADILQSMLQSLELDMRPPKKISSQSRRITCLTINISFVDLRISQTGGTCGKFISEYSVCMTRSLVVREATVSHGISGTFSSLQSVYIRIYDVLGL